MCLSSLAKALPSLHSMGLNSTSSVHVVELSFDFFFLFLLWCWCYLQCRVVDPVPTLLSAVQMENSNKVPAPKSLQRVSKMTEKLPVDRRNTKNSDPVLVSILGHALGSSCSQANIKVPFCSFMIRWWSVADQPAIMLFNLYQNKWGD